MSLPILVCDDSAFARRQMVRSIPDGWDVEINFAGHGEEALEFIRAGKAHLMFLDLNMPVMDDYETMKVIRAEDLQTLVIVVSGDVQEKARKTMLQLGALEFIEKPIDNAKLSQILKQYGLYEGEQQVTGRHEEDVKQQASLSQNRLDTFREMANIAMGQAGRQLAAMLDEFINLPIPNVNILAPSELHMAIEDIDINDRVSATSVGFVSRGIAGEALVMFSDANMTNMMHLLSYEETQNQANGELEALLDVSNILMSACIQGLSEQLHVHFSHNSPIVLGQNSELRQVLEQHNDNWKEVLAIELAYAIKSQAIQFDLLLLFPEPSIEPMLSRLIKEAHHAS
jgi:chemotaxis protein CheY-P-specific phosphatase CheC